MFYTYKIKKIPITGDEKAKCKTVIHHRDRTPLQNEENLPEKLENHSEKTGKSFRENWKIIQGKLTNHSEKTDKLFREN